MISSRTRHVAQGQTHCIEHRDERKKETIVFFRDDRRCSFSDVYRPSDSWPCLGDRKEMFVCEQKRFHQAVSDVHPLKFRSDQMQSFLVRMQADSYSVHSIRSMRVWRDVFLSFLLHTYTKMLLSLSLCLFHSPFSPSEYSLFRI